MARKQQTNKKNRVSDEAIYDAMLTLCGEAGPEKSIKPEHIAQHLTEFDWQALIKRIRRTAVQLAQAGYIHIMRKGKVADPDDFKGLYKVRLVEGVDWRAHLADETVNKGSGAGVPTTTPPDDNPVTIRVRS